MWNNCIKYSGGSILNIDHICFAVRSIDSSINKFCELMEYSIKTGKVTNTIQKVNVQFIEKLNSLDIKLIEPSCDDSPLRSFLKKGEGLHHVCFKTDDMNETIIRLTDKGARLLTGPEPGEAFDNEDISFLWLGHGLNIELINTDKRKSLINKK